MPSKFIAAIVLSTIVISSTYAAYQPPASNRQVLNLDHDWKFIRQDVPGADNPAFDDTRWIDVGLPHTYNDQDTYDKPPSPSTGDGGWGGKTWYRKHFTLDPQFASRQIYVEFRYRFHY